MSGASGPSESHWLEPALARTLSDLADVMIPGDDRYPPASETTAVEFVVRHLSEEEATALADLLRSAPTGTEDQGAWLRQMERDRGDRFALLRDHLYYGYYSSKRLLAALAQLGCEYRGAPQPAGFVITQAPPRPAAPRGRYSRTEEVRHVGT